jgi:hypothetical protein
MTDRPELAAVDAPPKISEAQYQEIERYLRLSSSDTQWLAKAMGEIRRICEGKPKLL